MFIAWLHIKTTALTSRSIENLNELASHAIKFMSHKSQLESRNMVFGNEFSRREFRSSFRVESFRSDSSGSEGEASSPSLSGTRKHNHTQRTKTFHQLVNEMSSSTRKLEEETSGLLRDLVRFIANKMTPGQLLVQ